jgi:hypothetical protein
MAGSDSPAVDVAVAAQLTGLSKDAIRARIRRQALASDLRDGRRRIPVSELHRQGLLVEGDRYASLHSRVESLEAELRTALETCELMQRQLQESQATARMLWTKARQRDQELAKLRGRKRRLRIRWPRRRKR